MLGIAFVIALSFFVRHLAGVVLVGTQYDAMVYNAASIRVIPPARYDFKPDEVTWDETREYGRFTQEILRGEWLGATPDSFNAYLAQGSFSSHGWYRDRLGPILLAAVAWVFSADVPMAFLLADLILPWLAAFLLLVLAWEIYPRLGFAVLATSLVMWFNWTDVLGLAQFLQGAPQDAALWLRTPYPQLSSPLLLLVFIALVHFHRQPTWLSAGAVGLALVATFYTYFYAWSFAFVMVGLYLALLVLPRTARPILQINQPRTRLTYLLPVTCIAVGVAFPVWGVLLQNSQEFHDSFLRVFGVLSHSPDWARTLILLSLLVVTLAVKPERWETRWFWVLFWGAAIVLWNQQVITGKVNQPGHWTQLEFEPLGLVFICDLGLALYRSSPKLERFQIQPRWIKSIVVILFLVGLGQNGYKLWRGAQEAVAYNDIDQSLKSLIVFLRAPEFARDGFLTNDPYLDVVLPAYVSQKPLKPWYMDPLTDEQIRTLGTARTVQFGKILGSSLDGDTAPPPAIRFEPSRVLLILNRHREPSTEVANCRPLLENSDFIVVKAQGCAE